MNRFEQHQPESPTCDGCRHACGSAVCNACLRADEDSVDDYWEPAPVEDTDQAPPADKVHSPAHYNQFPVEVIQLTRHLNFNRGNVVKYLCRAGSKAPESEVEDLQKARWYLDDEIQRLTGEGTHAKP